MEIMTRFLVASDSDPLHSLYRKIASGPGGFARDEEEITPAYIEKILNVSLANGVAIGAVDREKSVLAGFILARKPGPRAFDHVLTDLTIGVHPDYQSKGVGRRLFLDFLEHIQSNRSDILRVELIVRESNQRAISFYESIGFRSEGVLERRIRATNGEFESDIPMGWLKERGGGL